MEKLRTEYEKMVAVTNAIGLDGEKIARDVMSNLGLDKSEIETIEGKRFYALDPETGKWEQI